MTDKEIDGTTKDSTNTLLENVLDTLNVEADSKSETALDKPILKDIYRDAKGRWLPGKPFGRPPDSVSLVEAFKRRLREHPEKIEEYITQFTALGMKPNPNQLAAIKEAKEWIDGKSLETRKVESDVSVFVEFVPARALVRDIIEKGTQ